MTEVLWSCYHANPFSDSPILLKHREVYSPQDSQDWDYPLSIKQARDLQESLERAIKSYEIWMLKRHALK